MTLPVLYMMRHGETEWNRAGRMQGHLDSPLTAQGRAQAEALRVALAPVVKQYPELKAYASPQGRVRETWRIALSGSGLAPVEDPRLMEVRAGTWQGLTDAQMEEASPEIYAAHQTRIALSFHAPGGESFEDVEARCLGFLTRISGPALVFTHGVTMAVLRGAALGLGYSEIVELDHRQGVVYVLEGGAERVLTGTENL